MSGGVGGVTGAIPLPPPDPGLPVMNYIPSDIFNTFPFSAEIITPKSFPMISGFRDILTKILQFICLMMTSENIIELESSPRLSSSTRAILINSSIEKFNWEGQIFAFVVYALGSDVTQPDKTITWHSMKIEM